MQDPPDWLAYTMELGIPSSLAHDCLQEHGLDGLRRLCDEWAQGRRVLPEEILSAEIVPAESVPEIASPVEEEEPRDDGLYP